MFRLLFLYIVLFVFISCNKNTPTELQNNPPQNNSPQAVFTVDPTTGTIFTTFNFDASQSSDIEDDSSQLIVRWDWENDGIWDTEYTSDKKATHQFHQSGIYTSTLQVQDTDSAQSTASKQIEVIVESPVPLNVGNWWLYQDPKAPSIFIQIEIDSSVVIEELEGYKANVDMITPFGTASVMKLGWVWDDPLFKAYLYDRNLKTWNRFHALSFPSEIGIDTEWGFYKTTLMTKQAQIINYKDCFMYKLLNLNNQAIFYYVIKSGIGFVDLDFQGLLIGHQIAKVLEDNQLTTQKITITDYYIK